MLEMIQPLPNWLAVILEVKLVAKKAKNSPCDCSGCRYFFMLVCKYLLTSSTSKIIDLFSSLGFASSSFFFFKCLQDLGKPLLRGNFDSYLSFDTKVSTVLQSCFI